MGFVRVVIGRCRRFTSLPVVIGNLGNIQCTSRCNIAPRDHRLERYRKYSKESSANHTNVVYYTVILICGLYLTIGLAPLFLDSSISSADYNDPAYTDDGDRLIRAVYDAGSRQWIKVTPSAEDNINSILISESLF